MQEEKKELKSEFLLRESKIDIQTDKRLLIYEILSSKAHVISLEKINAITKEEAKLLIKTLNKLYNDYNAGKLVFDGNFEDIHFLVEDYLIKEIGIEVGGKLHIGRSRNELIINDVRMYLRDWINNFSLKFLEKLKELLNLADLEYKKLFISYTHLQQAQLITYGYYLLAHVEFLIRIYERLREVYKRLDYCVLGSGAIAGVNWPINRKLTAQLLGFRNITQNAMDSINSRGEIESELIFILSLLSIHLSRISEDLIIYSTQEFNLVEIPDESIGISSIMPQKRNPDSLELIRGKSSKIVSSLFEILFTLKSLPSGYNKDLQEIKTTLFNTLKMIDEIFEEIVQVIMKLKVKDESLMNSNKIIYTLATDIADYLVIKLGVSFRQAHKLISKAVNESYKNGKDFIKTVEDLLSLEGKYIKLGRFKDLRKSLYRKKSYGSSNPSNVRLIIKLRKKFLENEERKIMKEIQRINNYLKDLILFDF